MGNLWYSISVCLASCYLAMAGGYGPAEIELVFPRNETYAPIASFPVIFAIRNPQNILPELALEIRYYIVPYGVDQQAFRDDHTFLPGRDQDMLEGPNIKVAVGKTLQISEKENTWKLAYDVSFLNCTGGSNSSSMIKYDPKTSPFALDSTDPSKELVFTTKKGLARPDLVSLLERKSSKCSGDNAFAVQVQRLAFKPRDYPDPDRSTPYCAEVQEPAPKPKLCGSGIPMDIAKNISYTLAYQTCSREGSENNCSQFDSRGIRLLPVALLCGGAITGWLSLFLYVF